MQEIEINTLEDSKQSNYLEYKLETLEANNITYNDFFYNFMWKNLPCVVKNINSDWKCIKYWIKNDKICYDFFEKNYGDLEAPVADCDNIKYNAHNKINMKVKDYIEYLKNNPKQKLFYLKDWHLRHLKPDDNFYEVPIIFSSDWLNEFATDHLEDDFMFVYIGPENSWTPLHVDVYHSYSWSVNIIGKKKWILFPPGEENKIKDSLDNLPILFSPEKYKNIVYIEIIQEKGDAIFVPSDWHHQVVNLVDTISINHNWINACNIESVWEALNDNLIKVEKEIEEFRDSPDFNSQCQLILKSVFGMNFSEFFNFVSYIGQKRLNQLEQNTCVGYAGFSLGLNHIRFDLGMLLKIMNKICNHTLFLTIDTTPHPTKYNIIDIKDKIVNVLK